jgi:hypothetical protein
MPTFWPAPDEEDDYKSKCAALANAFRKLTIRRPTGTGIPCEFFIGDIGRQLMPMRPVPRRKLRFVLEVKRKKGAPKLNEQWDETPIIEDLPAKKAPKALHDLARSASRTLALLDGLSQPALDALNYQKDALRQLRIGLIVLYGAAIQAKVSPATKPEKIQERKIARVVAQHYYDLTGKAPSVSTKDGKANGPFLDLLNAVYEILDVRASAESQARTVAREWKSGQPERPWR